MAGRLFRKGEPPFLFERSFPRRFRTSPLAAPGRMRNAARLMTLGFIGCGKMATALVGGVVQSGAFPPDCIVVSDYVPEAAATLAEQTGVRAVSSNHEVVSASEALVLCVKPADAIRAIEALGTALDGKLLISIVA